MSEPDKKTTEPTTPTPLLSAVPTQSLDPNKPVFYIVSQDIMGKVVETLGELPANKVHNLLNQLNSCRPMQAESKPEQ